MTDIDGLVHAFVLDGTGGGKPLDWDGVRGWRHGDGALWIHVDHSTETARQWLRRESGLDPLVVDALLALETRPRCLVRGDGELVILRGVNLNPGADPEDMVAIRIWIDAHRVVSVRHRRLMAVQDIRERLFEGHGPNDTGDVLVAVTDRMVERMAPVIAEIDDSVDAVEDAVLTGESAELRGTIAGIRRQAIGLRRYIAPQREAMARLAMEPVDWLDEVKRGRLREIADRVTRYVEDLDAVRDRAQVIQDELSARLSEQMNRNMYLLSVVATILLPLSFLTGLLGINVGGIPGTDNPWAFATVCVILVALGAALAWLFRRAKWY